jgi:hypothetical protein
VRHTASVNAWRIIKLSFFLVIAVAMYSLTVENIRLQSDNVNLSMTVENLAQSCIVVGKP